MDGGSGDDLNDYEQDGGSTIADSIAEAVLVLMRSMSR